MTIDFKLLSITQETLSYRLSHNIRLLLSVKTNNRHFYHPLLHSYIHHHIPILLSPQSSPSYPHPHIPTLISLQSPPSYPHPPTHLTTCIITVSVGKCQPNVKALKLVDFNRCIHNLNSFLLHWSPVDLLWLLTMQYRNLFNYL